MAGVKLAALAAAVTISVTALQPSRCRAGMQFTAEPRDFVPGEITIDDLAKLCSDPLLLVTKRILGGPEEDEIVISGLRGLDLVFFFQEFERGAGLAGPDDAAAAAGSVPTGEGGSGAVTPAAADTGATETAAAADSVGVSRADAGSNGGEVAAANTEPAGDKQPEQAAQAPVAAPTQDAPAPLGGEKPAAGRPSGRKTKG